MPTQIQALQQLALLDWPGLDDYPDEPFVSVNPAASGRQVNEAVSALLKQWKAERELPEKRDRSEKYADYLKVWDLREGWGNGSYDRSQERTLKEIARERKTNLHTVRKHYCSAFQMIMGQAYSPELWCRLMGQLKLAELTEAVEARVSRKRPVKSPSRVAPPETQVGGVHAESGGPGVASGTRTAANDSAMNELIGDIQTLLANGATNAKVVQQLELSEKMLPAVEHLRRRRDIDGLMAQE